MTGTAEPRKFEDEDGIVWLAALEPPSDGAGVEAFEGQLSGPGTVLVLRSQLGTRVGEVPAAWPHVSERELRVAVRRARRLHDDFPFVVEHGDRVMRLGVRSMGAPAARGARRPRVAELRWAIRTDGGERLLWAVRYDDDPEEVIARVKAWLDDGMPSVSGAGASSAGGR